jgi:NADH:ubiquinone oxidoreductase subunit F (NADH-binding)
VTTAIGAGLVRLVDDRIPSRGALLGGSLHYLGNSADALTDLEFEGLGAHLRRFGPRPSTSYRDGVALIDVLDDIALTGRGGGHFPVAAKWRSVRAALDADWDRDRTTEGSVVVANGAESEPLSGKDAALLEYRPHLVLDGLACAAEALGAADAIVWLHEGAHSTRTAITRALAERAAAHLLEPRMRVVLGPDRYLSGESSAIVRALQGGPALPQFRRDPATPCRIDARPALVQNVETLARVAVAAYDPANDDDAATTLLSVAAPGQRVVLEVLATTRMREVVAAVLGHPAAQAVLVGGYGGAWIGWDDISDVALNEDALRRRGLSLGAGVLLTLPAGTCGLVRTAEIAAYLAGSSARQCGPCLFGLRAVADLTADLACFRSARRDIKRLQRFLAEVSGRGGCHHPDGAVRMVATAVITFAEDVAAHLRGRCVHYGRGSRGPG